MIFLTGVRKQVVILSCLYMGQILGGYSTAWSGPVIPKLRDLEQSPFPYLLTETQLTLTGTILYLGAITGPYIAAWLSNARGRKPCLLLSALLCLAAYAILATTRNVTTMFICRYIIGLSIGIITVVNLVYIGEIASTRIRGILLTVIGILSTVGFLTIYSIGPYVSYYGSLYIGLAINVIYLISLLWIPETPIFYALKGTNEQVVETLQSLGRPEDIDQMLKVKEESTETNMKKDWKELFTIRSNRKSLFIVLTINSLQHCCGLFVVIFFSSTIFDMAGSSIDSNIAMIIVTSFQLVGSIIAPMFIETTGRKNILLISSSICFLSMFTLGLYFYLDLIKNPIVDYIKWLPLVALALFFISYDSGLGAIPIVLTAEMFTSNVRSKGSTLTMTFANLCGFAVTTAFGALLKTVGGHVAFWFFSLGCACAFIFTFFFIPETKGKSLIEIQNAL